MNYINVGQQAYIDADEVIALCPYESFDRNAKRVIDLSNDTTKGKSVLITRSGTVFIVGVTFRTLVNRIKIKNR